MTELVEDEFRVYIRSLLLQYGFRLGKSTVCSILKKPDVIWNVLGNELVKAPSSVDEWKSISRDFYMKWNFPIFLLL